MTSFNKLVPAALVVALAFAGALAACASLVGVQDGVLEEAGADGTTEAALAETGADVTTDAASEATSDATTARDAAVDSATTPDAPAAEDTGAAEAGLEDSGVGAEATAPDASEAGCAGRVVDPTVGVFVAPGGSTAPNCGLTQEAPCGTIQSGLNTANANGAHNIVYVAAGTYIESITLYANVTVQGGWNESGDGGTWTPACSDAGAPSSGSVTIVAPTTTNVTVTAADLGGTATLSTLTIASKAQGAVQPGESIYGIIATGTSTTVVLDDVMAQIAGGGAGMNGSPGLSMPAATGSCVAGSGADGGLGPVGTGSNGGTFSATGYVAGNGTTGPDAGVPGGNGVAGGNAVCANCAVSACGGTNCSVSTTKTCGENGLSGCGGAGGGAGAGAGGGGSSIVVYVYDATVNCNESILAAGPGGDGGIGGPGGAGGAGSAGSKGTSAGSCPTNGSTGLCTFGCSTSASVFLDGGSAGGAGGTGGAGGQGGGGAGGSSCTYFAGGLSGVFSSSSCTLTYSTPGSGGALGGASGFAQPRCP